MSNTERFHRAARDGYIDLLKDSTRKDCNAADEDGITPTLWSAYAGNLDALRALVGRGGDPGKCDNLGNTALHWSAANGHMNCVSFLVSFGVNLWALDNDYHTAKDVAAINHREEIIHFLDQVIAKQSALNTKIVQKLKEKAILDADKRIKAYQKFQKKLAKRAEKEEKQVERRKKKTSEVINKSEKDVSEVNENQLTLRRDSRLQANSSLKFSDIVNLNAANTTTGTTNKIKILGGVSRKVNMKKQNTDSVSTTSDFKVRDMHSDDGTRSVRSLMGIRRDNQILYVPKFDSISNSNESASVTNLNVNRLHMKDVFNDIENINCDQHRDKLYRAISEPDFMNHFDDSEIKQHKDANNESSIFVRPGFGSVSFRGKFTSQTLFSKHLSDESSVRRSSDRSSAASYADSIGSAGSLAQRNAFHLCWDDDQHKDMNASKTVPIFLFLYAHGLKEYINIFKAEKIDLDALLLLNEEDLISLGLPLGPRRKILKAIKERKIAFEYPGEIRDSRL